MRWPAGKTAPRVSTGTSHQCRQGAAVLSPGGICCLGPPTAGDEGSYPAARTVPVAGDGQAPSVVDSRSQDVLWIAIDCQAKWSCYHRTHPGGDHASCSRPTRSTECHPHRPWRYLHLAGIEPIQLAGHLAVAGQRRKDVEVCCT